MDMDFNNISNCWKNNNLDVKLWAKPLLSLQNDTDCNLYNLDRKPFKYPIESEAEIACPGNSCTTSKCKREEDNKSICKEVKKEVPVERIEKLNITFSTFLPEGIEIYNKLTIKGKYQCRFCKMPIEFVGFETFSQHMIEEHKTIVIVSEASDSKYESNKVFWTDATEAVLKSDCAHPIQEKKTFYSPALIENPPKSKITFASKQAEKLQSKNKMIYKTIRKKYRNIQNNRRRLMLNEHLEMYNLWRMKVIKHPAVPCFQSYQGVCAQTQQYEPSILEFFNPSFCNLAWIGYNSNA